MAASDSSSDDTGLSRLKRFFQAATQRVDSGDEVPEMPKELGEWGTNTSLAMFAGICFYGARQWVQLKRLGPYMPLQPGLSKAREARLIAEENTRRLLQLSRETVKGGLLFGASAGLFSGLEVLSTIANGGKTVRDTVLAASVTGGFFGSLLPNQKLHRIRSGVLGAALGACAGFPVGMLQIYVREKFGSQEEQQTAAVAAREKSPTRTYPELLGDPTEGVIQQLEASLRK